MAKRKPAGAKVNKQAAIMEKLNQGIEKPADIMAALKVDGIEATSSDVGAAKTRWKKDKGIVANSRGPRMGKSDFASTLKNANDFIKAAGGVKKAKEILSSGNAFIQTCGGSLRAAESALEAIEQLT